MTALTSSVDFYSFDSRDELDRLLARYISGKLENDIAIRGTATLAVSGGSTPAGFFSYLGDTDIDWSRIIITLIDERWVDPESEGGNEHLVRRRLLNSCARNARFVGL